jgi:uncharacterized secreted protein with C-terminal beta-propeller domain
MQDSAVSPNFAPISLSSMRFFTGHINNSLIIVCGIDLAKPEAAVKVESILGSGNIVYMSLTSLYVARHDWGHGLVVSPRGISGQSTDMTTFFKFDLNNGAIRYQAQAVTEGHVLNQFSMDEYNGYFRVALSINQWQENSQNKVEIYDSRMRRVGKADNIAPGERIYSARFMGDRGFVVTFRTVDPLFALDLSDPRNPKVLGELKIPGYSNYLHPFGENHLIGFGRETEEMRTIDSRGNVVNTWAAQRGLKLSLFDVSDMLNPIEVHAIEIGNEFTHSEFEHNPKAMLLCEERGFIAFPVTQWNWGRDHLGRDFDEFAGVHVYDFNTEGFALRGHIKMQEDEKLRAEMPWRFQLWEAQIERVIFIGDMFYSASHRGMQANNMKDLAFVNQVVYPERR